MDALKPIAPRPLPATVTSPASAPAPSPNGPVDAATPAAASPATQLARPVSPLVKGLSEPTVRSVTPRHFDSRAEVRAFIDDMVRRHGFDRTELERLFAQATRRDDVLQKISRPAESKSWAEYRKIFLTDARTAAGVQFWRENEALLARAQETYGVPAEVIVGILGVETLFGRNTGDTPALDALATLAFDYPPRADFFRSELEQYLLLCREEGLDPSKLRGSYAAAFGVSQFISSSYRYYAVDFDDDGVRNLWSTADAIGSVANYFAQHGWREGQPVVTTADVRGDNYKKLLNRGRKPSIPVADLTRHGVTPRGSLGGEPQVAFFEQMGDGGPEYWVGLNNFYVITRYNTSPLYAMAVHELSQAVRSQHDPAAFDIAPIRNARTVAPISDRDAGVLTPAEMHRRTQLVLRHFGVPVDPPSAPRVADLQHRVTASTFLSRLQYLDPEDELWRYATLTAGANGAPSVVRVYKDRDSKQELDFEIALRDTGAQPTTLHARLIAAKSNPASKPLAGLRIALDPGHMGGDTWPTKTGKYIQEGGVTLNEGDINLQSTHLLAKRLRALGAEVLETRTTHELVTKQTAEQLDLVSYGREALRGSTTNRWFQSLVRSAKDDRALIAAFEASPQRQALFDEGRRESYLLGRTDLDARAASIQAFKPDIVLVVHYDVRIRSNSDHGTNASAPNGTKSYVAGSFLEGELGRSEDRIQLARHAAAAEPWDASVQLSRAVSHGLHDGLGVEPETLHSPVAKRVEPGVFSRNLHLTRALSDVAFAYVETLYYNRPSEFFALSSTRDTTVIDGVRYPKRMQQVVEALESGIVSFVRQYDAMPGITNAPGTRNES